jgi:hypothetical protein
MQLYDAVMQPNGRHRLIESHVEYTFCDDLWKYIKEFAFHQDPDIVQHIASQKRIYTQPLWMVYWCEPKMRKIIKDRRKALFPRKREDNQTFEKTIEVMLTEPEHQDEIRHLCIAFGNKCDQFIDETLANPILYKKAKLQYTDLFRMLTDDDVHQAYKVENEIGRKVYGNAFWDWQDC